jgi:3-phosphoshikimate 1-carboxyvinyltransferase
LNKGVKNITMQPNDKFESRSQWSTLQDVGVIKLSSTRHPISGIVTLPGSKSLTNRAIIIAAVAEGNSSISGILRSDDSYWCIEALRQLGVSIEDDGNNLVVTGRPQWQPVLEPIFIGSAGTTGRFLTSLIALSTQTPIKVRASAQLSRRPMQPLFDALISLGANIRYDGEAGYFPITIEPKNSQGASLVQLSGGKSSQFISGLLIASPLLGRPLNIAVSDGIVQSDYVRITLDVMAKFGVYVDASPNLDHFSIAPGKYRATDLAVEADASTATYFLALAAATGGVITFTNLRLSNVQPDIRFIDVLKRMGCRIEAEAAGLTIKGPTRLRGGFAIDMHGFSDSALTLAALAPFADAPIEINGVEHIRTHESDRLKVMTQALLALGVKVEERRDGLRITPGLPRMGQVETHDDHRIAMSLAVLGVVGSGIELIDPGCVSKTCPSFFSDLTKLGIEVING